MTDGWTFGGEPVSLAQETVTLVEGSTFCLSNASGDMFAEVPHGFFFRDTRLLSGWVLEVDHEPVEPLSAIVRHPFRAVFVSRTRPRAGQAESTLVLERRRYIDVGMREDIILRNLTHEPAACLVTLTVDSDFADLFQVKEGRVRPRGEQTLDRGADWLRIRQIWLDRVRGVHVSGEGATAIGNLLSFRVVVPARGEWSTTVLVSPIRDGEVLASTFAPDRPVETSAPVQRHRAWHRGAPLLTSENEDLLRILQRSQEDLGALRIFDADHPDTPAVAAGAPWFMALFGRDSILSSYMALAIDPTLALGTLQTLARLQGTKEDPYSEEQPGRILHEVRFDAGVSLALGGSDVYYGTLDATPLFVILFGELRRWGLAGEATDALLPHAYRALEWIENYGDRDGDGFLEYQRTTDRGLVNQGWKDSWNGINFADGRIAHPPIAPCEVQGYAYMAYLTGALVARLTGDADRARHWAAKAQTLKLAFNERFWLPDKGWYAVGLEGLGDDKRVIDALTSNIGHCLWTGIVDEDKAAQVASHLISPAMFSGWGVRTLAASMGAYNPMSYHNGSVWPHDSTLVAAGLMRYGFVAEAQQIAVALLDAASAFGGRLPELFCGFTRAEYPTPIPFPTSCSPQAWASAAPVHLLRTMLRFDPWMPRRQVYLDPAIPPEIGDFCLDNVPLAGQRVAVEVKGDDFKVRGLPDDIELLRNPRPLLARFLPQD